MNELMLRVKDDFINNLIDSDDLDGEFLSIRGVNVSKRDMVLYVENNPDIAFTLLINTILVLSNVISERE